MKAAAIHKLLATAPMSAPDAMWEQLYAAYQTPPRSYHTFDHVRAVLEHYALVEREIGWSGPREVYTAVLYHDAVYVCGRLDNEAQSAQLALASLATWLPGAGIDGDRVAKLIELTAHHGHNKRSEIDGEAAMFLDCDLAILGAEADAYERFSRQVAREYEAVIPPDAYKQGRRKFLGDVQAAERIFLSDFFETRLAHRARANVAAELASLASG